MPPKLVLLIWKILHWAIPTQDILKSHHLNTNQRCVFGCQEEESLTFSSHVHSPRLSGLVLSTSDLQSSNQKDNLSRVIIMIHLIGEKRNVLSQRHQAESSLSHQAESWSTQDSAKQNSIAALPDPLICREDLIPGRIAENCPGSPGNLVDGEGWLVVCRKFKDIFYKKFQTASILPLTHSKLDLLLCFESSPAKSTGDHCMQ